MSLGAAVAIILVVIGAGFLALGAAYFSESDVTCNLRDKNIVPTGSGSTSGHDYRMNCDTPDGNKTFVVEDSIIKGQFNTGDIYFRLHEGRKYECQTYGWRHPFLSAFPALINCEDVGTADPEAGR